jgi:hypothetical protein
MTGSDKYGHECEGGSSAPPPPASVSSAPPPPVPLVCSWSLEAAGSGWCAATHPGQAGYTQAAGNAIVDDLGHGVWQLNTDNGWRFKSLTLDECKDACVTLDSDCAEMSVTSKGWCYPAASTCDGTAMTGSDKYGHECV